MRRRFTNEAQQTAVRTVTRAPLAYNEQDAAAMLGITPSFLAEQRRLGKIAFRTVGGSLDSTVSGRQPGRIVYEACELSDFLKRQPKTFARKCPQ